MLDGISQAEGIVKLPVGEQPGIRGDLGTVEFKLQSTVKNDPKAPRFRFTHRVCHSSPLKKALLTGFHSTAKHNATKAVSPSSETMRTI